MITKWTAGSNVKRACKIFSIENNQFLYISKSVAIMVKFPADLVTFTEEILNGKLHFLCSDKINIKVILPDLVGCWHSKYVGDSGQPL